LAVLRFHRPFLIFHSLNAMHLTIHPTKQALGAAAANDAAEAIRTAVAESGRARIIAATGASQFEFLAALVSLPDVPWPQVEMFHLDEYIGVPADHPASFRRYLRERLIEPAGIRTAHLLDAEHDPASACARIGALLVAAPVDVAFVGIGENGHLAFNDPPADFETREPYLVVSLDEACRRQQVGEGWFPTLDAVPTQAVSMSCRQILAARRILCIVPDARKAAAVRGAVEGPVMPHLPASILQTHDDVTLYLDTDSASALQQR
jgi:glucosamine-6-phosphate deaminase